jgi:hypothetical protein
MNSGSHQSIIYLDILKISTWINYVLYSFSSHGSSTLAFPFLQVFLRQRIHLICIWNHIIPTVQILRIMNNWKVHTYIFISCLWSFSLLIKLGKNTLFSQTVILYILRVEGPTGWVSMSPPHWPKYSTDEQKI